MAHHWRKETGRHRGTMAAGSDRQSPDKPDIFAERSGRPETDDPEHGYPLRHPVDATGRSVYGRAPERFAGTGAPRSGRQIPVLRRSIGTQSLDVTAAGRRLETTDADRIAGRRPGTSTGSWWSDTEHRSRKVLLQERQMAVQNRVPLRRPPGFLGSGIRLPQ